MSQPDPTSRRPGLWTALAVTAVAGASAVTIALPHTALAEPVPPTTTATHRPRRRPRLTRTRPLHRACPRPPRTRMRRRRRRPPPADPLAPAASGRPGRPRSRPAAAGRSGRPPRARRLRLPRSTPRPARRWLRQTPMHRLPPAEAGIGPGQQRRRRIQLPGARRVGGGRRLPAELRPGAAAQADRPGTLPGQPAPTANDTSILLGRLDLKLFAGAEPDNSKAAVRLASDMGEFFMPFPGTRINQADLAAAGRGYARVRGVLRRQIHRHHQAQRSDLGRCGGIGAATQRNQPGDRWFVVWLGTGKDPIDTAAAKALASVDSRPTHRRRLRPRRRRTPTHPRCRLLRVTGWGSRCR